MYKKPHISVGFCFEERFKNQESSSVGSVSLAGLSLDSLKT